MIRPVHAAAALAVIIPVGVVAGCGSSSSSTASTPASAAQSTTTQVTTAATTTAPSAAKAVAITADPSGALAFEQKALTAAAGTITFKFTNASQVPHNVTFENAGTENELGATKTVTGGTSSVTLTLPKGKYNFYCSVPGHEAAGMRGTMVVQ